MKSDREFIDGIYAKAKERQQERDGGTIYKKSRHYGWYKGFIQNGRRLIPAAICLLLLLVLAPRYITKKAPLEATPDTLPQTDTFGIEPNTYEKDNTEPEIAGVDGNTAAAGTNSSDVESELPDTDIMSIPNNQTENEGTLTLSPRDDRSLTGGINESNEAIATVQIVEVKVQDNVHYLIAKTKEVLQGTAGDLLMIVINMDENVQSVEFIAGEIDLLYLSHMNYQETTDKNMESYIFLYHTLFNKSKWYEENIVPDIFALEDAVNNKYKLQEETNGKAIYESAGGKKITEDEVKNIGR